MDTGFADAGSFSVDAGLNSVALAGDGKIVVGGYSEFEGDYAFWIERRNADGTPDTGFAGGAPVHTRVLPGAACYADHVDVAPDGKVYAGGETYNNDIERDMLALVRYQVDPDPQPVAGGTGPLGATPPPLGPLALSGLRVTRRSFAVGRPWDELCVPAEPRRHGHDPHQAAAPEGQDREAHALEQGRRQPRPVQRTRWAPDTAPGPLPRDAHCGRPGR